MEAIKEFLSQNSAYMIMLVIGVLADFIFQTKFLVTISKIGRWIHSKVSNKYLQELVMLLWSELVKELQEEYQNFSADYKQYMADGKLTEEEKAEWQQIWKERIKKKNIYVQIKSLVSNPEEFVIGTLEEVWERVIKPKLISKKK